MRIELERTEKIEHFLLGLFNKEEENQFKQQLISDSDLALELKWQKLLMKRIEKIALKQEISVAHNRYMQKFRFSFKNKVFRNFVISFSSILIIILGGILTVNLVENQPNIHKETEPLFSPIVNSELPFNKNRVRANETVLLNYKTGTFIIIPSDAFIDENNVLVAGEVDIRFREFNGKEKPPINPKNDSLVLESVLMFEFYAFKKDKPLKIKHGKEIEIVQLTKTTSPLFSVYQYDNNEQNWSESGRDVSFDLSGQVIDKQLISSLLEGLHIENPNQDPEILREQETYLEILKHLHILDSVNNEIEQKYMHSEGRFQKRTDVLNEVLDLYRQRMVLIANTENMGLKDTLIKIKPNVETLNKYEDFLEKEYKKFTKYNLKNISKDLSFCRAYSINKTGLWSIGIPINK